jgi:hypothetical protein
MAMSDERKQMIVNDVEEFLDHLYPEKSSFEK